MVIEFKAGRWKFTHACAHGKHTEGPFTSKKDAEDALREHEEKCGS